MPASPASGWKLAGPIEDSQVQAGPSGGQGWSLAGPIQDAGAPPPAMKENPVSRVLNGAWEMVNPMGLVRSLAHPINMLKQGVEFSGQEGNAAVQALGKGDVTSAVGHAVGAIPVVGPIARTIGYNLGSGEPDADPWKGVGEALGLAVPGALGEGVRRLGPSLSGKVRASAENSAASAVNPTGMKNRQLARDIVAPQVLDRGVMKPFQSLPDLSDAATAGKQAAGADIAAKEGALFGNPQLQTAHPVSLFTDYLEQMKAGSLKGVPPTRVNGVLVDPSREAVINRLQTALAETAKQDWYANAGPWSSANGPNLSDKALLEFRQMLDNKIQERHVQVPGAASESVPLSVARPLSNVLRRTFNDAHPDIAQAFGDYRFYKTFETLANRAETARTGAKSGLTDMMRQSLPLVTAFATGGFSLASGINPVESGAAAVLAGGLMRAVNSTGWKTTSAVVKNGIADAMAQGRFNQALEIGRAAGLWTAGANAGSGAPGQTPSAGR